MKLLVAVDGSEHSAKAVATRRDDCAAELHADVVVLHQRSDEAHGPRTSGTLRRERDRGPVDRRLRLSSALLAAGAASAAAQVVRGLHGEEAQAIIDVARDEDADIIVVGPRGLGRLQGLLLGSVTSKLVQLADRPVLVVR